MGRSSCCSKEGLNRGAWTAREDKALTDYIKTHGEGRWSSLPKRAGLKRCGKSCRLRWMNYLRPDIKRGNISPDEEELILRLHRLLGNRWSLIAGRLPGRTDNEIKNYWNTTLGKRVQVHTRISASAQNNKNKKQNQPKKIPLLIDKNMVNSSPRVNVDVIRTRAFKCTKAFVDPRLQNCPVSEDQTPESDYVSGTGGSLSSFSRGCQEEINNGSTLMFGDLMMDFDKISCEFSFSDFLGFDLSEIHGNSLSSTSSADKSLEEILRDLSGNNSVHQENTVDLDVPSFTSFLATEEDWLGE